MEPSFDHWTSLFLIAACQGIFLAILLLRRGSNENRFLSALILSFSLCLVYYVLFWTGYYKVLPRQLGLAQGLTYLFGPLLLLYVQGVKSYRRYDFLHLAPFALYTFRYLLESPLRDIPGSMVALSQILHLSIYTALIFSSIRQSQINTTNGKRSIFTWRKMVGIAFLAYVISFTSYFILVWTGLLKLEYDYMISAASAVFIYFIGFNGLHYREWPKEENTVRYERSGLTSTASHAISQKLNDLMIKEKVYLRSSLKLNDLAELLDVQPHHVSQVINEIEGKNFADFINGYRIKQAKLLLGNSDQKILSVALSSGYNNKTSFNYSFKKQTGMAPSAYRQKRILDQEKGKVLSA
ncbi:MAG: helix-turn-helix transcriptional regulator [Bacteroidota bacterium]